MDPTQPKSSREGVAPRRLRRAPATASVLVVDDHPLVRRGLARLLAQEPDLAVTAEAGTAAEARDALRNAKPDLILLDLSLPGTHGLDLLRELQGLTPETPVLILSVHDETLYASRCLRAGARGYLSKSAPVEEIVGAMRRVLSGRVYVSETVSAALVRQAAGGVDPGRDPVRGLSDRELQVFELLGRGLTIREIGVRLGLSPKTADTHRSNIRSKLHLASTAEVMRLAVQWILEGR